MCPRQQQFAAWRRLILLLSRRLSQARRAALNVYQLRLWNELVYKKVCRTLYDRLHQARARVEFRSALDPNYGGAVLLGQAGLSPVIENRVQEVARRGEHNRRNLGEAYLGYVRQVQTIQRTIDELRQER